MVGNTDRDELTTWTWHGFLLPPSDLLNLTVSFTGGRFLMLLLLLELAFSVVLLLILLFLLLLVVLLCLRSFSLSCFSCLFTPSARFSVTLLVRLPSPSVLLLSVFWCLRLPSGEVSLVLCLPSAAPSSSRFSLFSCLPLLLCGEVWLLLLLLDLFLNLRSWLVNFEGGEVFLVGVTLVDKEDAAEADEDPLLLPLLPPWWRSLDDCLFEDWDCCIVVTPIVMFGVVITKMT